MDRTTEQPNHQTPTFGRTPGELQGLKKRVQASLRAVYVYNTVSNARKASNRHIHCVDDPCDPIRMQILSLSLSFLAEKR
ncbi:MAG: hypothetical protein Q9210_002686 [Variospora velana]